MIRSLLKSALAHVKAHELGEMLWVDRGPVRDLVRNDHHVHSNADCAGTAG